MALYLKRVETVVSLKQLAEPGTDEAGCACGSDVPVSGMTGCRVPKYFYASEASPKMPRLGSLTQIMGVPDVDDASHGSDSDDGVLSSAGSVLDAAAVPERSLLDTIILASWQEKEEQGLFRYDVTACPTKVVPGVYGFVAQLNEGRATKKRPTEFRVDQVCQDFDASKFNFTKAFNKEVLFAFEPAAYGDASHFQEGMRAGASPNLVLINVSPIEYGHILLCPKVLDNVPQLMDPSTVLTALHFALEVGNPYMRVGYNSLGAFATINHLHYQAYYLNAPLPCERAPTSHLKGLKRQHRGDVTISRLVDYPVRGFVIEGGSLQDMADVVGQAALVLQAQNIPHNALISDCGQRVFLFPQAYAERQARGEVEEELLATGVNPACWEIAGHMVFKAAQDYDNVTQESIWRLLSAVGLDEEAFLRVGQLCFGAAARATLTPSSSCKGAAAAAAPSTAPAQPADVWGRDAVAAAALARLQAQQKEPALLAVGAGGHSTA